MSSSEQSTRLLAGHGIPVLDLNAYLCEDNKCRAVRNGTLLYRDDSHLTATAVKALLPAVQAQIRDKKIDLSGR